VGDGALTKAAKDLGQQGWEMVSVAVTPEGTTFRNRQYIMCFKRPLLAP
jgi:hypothetical protein